MNLHTRVLVTDLDRSLAFYRDLLGFSVRFGGEEMHYVHLSAPDGGEIGLYPREMMADVVGTRSESSGEGGDQIVLVLDVSDVDGEVNRLKQGGVPLVTEPQDRPLWRERTAHVRDPDGNLVEIKSFLSQ